MARGSVLPERPQNQHSLTPAFFHARCFPSQLKPKLPASGVPQRRKKVDSVITNRALALKVYTPQRLYAVDFRSRALLLLPRPSQEDSARLLKEGKAAWSKLSKEDRLVWEQEARRHDEQHPSVLPGIRDALKSNPTLAFDVVARSIGNWCSGETIRRLFWSLEYNMYMQRVLPLLSKDNMKEAVIFSRRVRRHWGLTDEQLRKGVIWLHWDEKWWKALVARKGAKMCDALDIPRSYLLAKHKDHIDQVMGICFVGYAFKGHIENGGVGISLGLHRVCSPAVAGRLQRAATHDEETGKTRFQGEILRRKGDLWEKDCTLTSTSIGTASKPKMSLTQLWDDSILGQLDTITGIGGAFEGYTVVDQCDNGGPHRGEEFVAHMEAEFAKRNWIWDFQGPQMPHSNACDLQVFPMMSKQQTSLQIGRSSPSKNHVWKLAERVFSTISAADIASSFVLAYRLLGKTIEHGGNNEFLNGGGYHCGVRNDFRHTDHGIERIDGKTFGPDA